MLGDERERDRLEALGADIEVTDGYVRARSNGRLVGCDVHMDLVTVGGTQNLMMAATLASGTTRLFNAACEPETVDLGNFLNALGAKVSGHGTSTIEIEGVEALHGGSHRVMPDRVEAGTYLVAAAVTGGGCARRWMSWRERSRCDWWGRERRSGARGPTAAAGGVAGRRERASGTCIIRPGR